MKNLFFLLIVFILAISLVYAIPQNNQNIGNQQQIGQQTQQKNQGDEKFIANEIQSTIRLVNKEIEIEGKKVQILEKEQDRTRLRIRVGNISAECVNECNITQEQDKEQNRTRLRVMLSNGKNAEIKIMPDVASEVALERLRLKVCSEDNNCSIVLKEVGKGNETKLAYEMQMERHVRILGLFKTKSKVKAQVDAENGKIIEVKKPWWSFLSKEE
ncbi:MAG: hypothetical protein QW117_01925 [Candidatus Pacearchaeota archaeon]